MPGGCSTSSAKGRLDDGRKDLTLESTEVEASGDLVYAIGDFSVQVSAENNTATGNYLVVWKRAADGDSQLQVDAWNDAPAN